MTCNTDHRKNVTRGRLILLMSLLAAFWGMSFFGSNVALKYMNTFQILSVRWTISMFIFIFLIVTGKVKLRIDENLPWLLATGILQPCLYSICETEGVRLTSTSETSIFIAAIPGTALLSHHISTVAQRIDRFVHVDTSGLFRNYYYFYRDCQIGRAHV